jgi:hypothetical protein
LIRVCHRTERASITQKIKCAGVKSGLARLANWVALFG